MPKPINSLSDALAEAVRMAPLLGPDVFSLDLVSDGQSWQINVQAQASPASELVARRMGLRHSPEDDHGDDHYGFRVFRGVSGRIPLRFTLSWHLVRRVSGRP